MCVGGWVPGSHYIVVFDCISNLGSPSVLIMRANQKIDDYNQHLTSQGGNGEYSQWKLAS